MKHIIILLTALFCAVFSNAQELPASWQKNMTLVIYNGPGMFPGWNRTIISDTASYTVGYDGRRQIKQRYHFTARQLNALLDELRKNHFEKATSISGPGITYDKPDRSMVLSWQGHSIYVGENASTSIAPESAGAVSRIRAYIYTLTGR